MINERIAITMLEGKTPCMQDDPHDTKQFYKSIRVFAQASLQLCEEGKYQKLEQFMKVAFKLFQEGNDTVKNGIVNVYLPTLSVSMDGSESSRKSIEPFMPYELRLEYKRQHYVGGM